MISSPSPAVRGMLPSPSGAGPRRQARLGEQHMKRWEFLAAIPAAFHALACGQDAPRALPGVGGSGTSASLGGAATAHAGSANASPSGGTPLTGGATSGGSASAGASTVANGGASAKGGSSSVN